MSLICKTDGKTIITVNFKEKKSFKKYTPEKLYVNICIKTLPRQRQTDKGKFKIRQELTSQKRRISAADSKPIFEVIKQNDYLSSAT